MGNVSFHFEIFRGIFEQTQDGYMWSFYELLLKVSWSCRFDPSPSSPLKEDASTLRSFAESKSSKVGDLKILAKESFAEGFLRLRMVMGMSFAPWNQKPQAKRETTWRLLRNKHSVAATGGAFALWCRGGDRLVRRYLGRSQMVETALKSKTVQDQLRNVLFKRWKLQCHPGRWLGCHLGRIRWGW